MSRTSAIAVIALWLVASVTGASAAATVVDPALRFRRLETAHFVIYFHQGEDALAARLAGIAERTYADMGTRFGWTLPPRTHVVLADQADAANGWATPLPYNTIMITAAWPSGAEFIGQTDDWLHLVFAHEFTHIVHLDRSRGWARTARTIFGRIPVAFPNLFLPGWHVEGIATYFESALTGRGRQFAGDFRAIEREPAREGHRVPLDRANGGLIAWPGGTSVYAYGLGFHEYLGRAFGTDRLVGLADATAGRVPYTGSRAFEGTFGQALGPLWTAYQSELQAAVAGSPTATGARQLTNESYDIAGARFLPPTCAACAEEIAYSVRNPHEFPALKVIAAGGGAARTLTTRYLGGAIGAGAARLVFDQRELHRNISLLSDLYAVDRQTGRVRRLTWGARLQDPDVTRDGHWLVATRQDRGARHLVKARVLADGSLGPIETVIDDPESQFVAPRWSPDGSLIAVERHRLGEGAQVVVVDPVERSARVVATGATRAVTPAWRPDGRALVAAADEQDAPFNLFEFALDGRGGAVTRRRLTATTGGALSPDVSADGRTLLYVGYTPTGFDLFSEPYPGATDGDAEVRDRRPEGPSRNPAAAAQAAQAEPYTPWATLLPRSWVPLLTSDTDQTRAGLSVGGTDVLGYHAYAAAVQWRISSPDGAPGGRAATPDWSALYAYSRWVPQLYASASHATSFLTGASAVDGVAGTLREQMVEAGVQWPLRRVLRSQRFLLAATRSSNTLQYGDGEHVYGRVALRTGWSLHTARTYGYSISPEDGLAAGVTAEVAGPSASVVDRATTTTSDLRAYMPGLARHHVLALRAGGGFSTGPRESGRVFRLGGGASNPETIDFGRSAFSLLRGFAPDAFAGRRVAVLNAEYRWPVARIERGHGTWPFFLRQLHGGVFGDAGHAWVDRFRGRDVKVAAGVELSADIVVGFALPLTVTAGVARGHDGARRVRDGTTGYLRVGRAF